MPVLRHSHRTSWVPNGTGQRCVGRNVVLKPYSLGYWQNGSWARVRKQGVAHCHPMDLRTRRKRKLLFLEKVGTAEQKRKIILPALHQGMERRCSRHLLRKSKFQLLQVARVRAASSTSWTTWGLAGTRGGAALLREARRAGQGIDSAWGGAALEDAGGCPRQRAD